jgi:uncharacterized membrane protein YgdD (TMEM256/DUF423 family)
VNFRARVLLVLGALSLAAATGLGAYASHGLTGVLDARQLNSLLTAIDYQFYHSLGLLAVGILNDRKPQIAWLAAGGLFVAGIVLFSGGIYASTFVAPWLSSAAPFGGIFYILGWLVCAYAAARSSGPNAAAQ